MPAVVIPIAARGVQKKAAWSLLEVTLPGREPEPYGILLADEETDELTLRLREEFADGADDEIEEQTRDVLAALEADLVAKAREMGGKRLIGSLEDSLSGFFRIHDRTAIAYAGAAQATVDRLYDEYVAGDVQPFVTHLPLYHLRAAAGKFGEEMQGEQEGWVRVPRGLRPAANMFVAQVVGRSMEPVIPDGSLCVFRGGVTGSRQERRVLVEQLGETDTASRYTVKRYTSKKAASEDGSWLHERIRLEPLNPEYEAFDLSGDEFGSQFRVIAEFVGVLYS